MPSGDAELDALLGRRAGARHQRLAHRRGRVWGSPHIALTYAIAAAGRNEHSAIFAFDEGRGIVNARAKTLGLPLEAAMASGYIGIQQIDPTELSPGELTNLVRTESGGRQGWHCDYR